MSRRLYCDICGKEITLSDPYYECKYMGNLIPNFSDEMHVPFDDFSQVCISCFPKEKKS
jgi:hypothetical protein